MASSGAHGWEKEDDARRRPTTAAEYVRMSTEHQRYSTESQSDAIRRYAEERGIEIVRTYADEGKSGLRIDGRSGLKQLIDDIQNGNADYEAVLVYDVSRWGRFQDADESAYFEYICKRAGISVIYCAEQFENDGSPVSTIVKSVKRAMAGEYSRELSHKAFVGQCRLIELGYRQGGAPGYARSLLAATPSSQLARSDQPKAIRGVSPEQIAMMERESPSLGRELRQVERTYGADHLDLVLVRGYVTKLIGNARIVRYLAQNDSEFLAEFQRISEAATSSA